MKVAAPIYLLFSTAACPRCCASNPVVAIGAINLQDDEGSWLPNCADDPELYLLNYIETLPPEISRAIARYPVVYEQHCSRMSDSTYWANMCECGFNFGDHFLYSEPGGAFFPETESDAAQIQYVVLDLLGELEIGGGFSVGGGSLILPHARNLANQA